MKHIKNIEVGDIVYAPNGIDRQKDCGSEFANDPPGTEYEVLGICWYEDDPDWIYGDILTIPANGPGNDTSNMTMEEARLTMGNREGAEILVDLCKRGIEFWFCSYKDVEPKSKKQ
jgi:hypothetical protein